MLWPIFLKLILPFTILSLVSAVLIGLGHAWLLDVVFVGYTLVIGIEISLCCWGLGKVIGNPNLGTLVPICFVFPLAMLLLIQNYFMQTAVLNGSDYMKAFIAVIVNPLLFEVFAIMPGRFVARLLEHNHPSTSLMVVAIPMALQKAWGRSTLALIVVPWIAPLSAFALGAVEVVKCITLKRRDRASYRSIGCLLPEVGDH